MITDYVNFQHWLTDAGIEFSPSFVQGVLSAYCCKTYSGIGWSALLWHQSSGADKPSTDKPSATAPSATASSTNAINDINAIDVMAQQSTQQQSIGARQDSTQTLANYQDKLKAQLDDPDCDYQLLLPTDDNAHQLALAIREWASGFWLGLQQSHLINNLTDSHSKEYLSDLQRISAMPLPDEADSDSLVDIAEIQEYCRMGAISLYLSSWR